LIRQEVGAAEKVVKTKVLIARYGGTFYKGETVGKGDSYATWVSYDFNGKTIREKTRSDIYLDNEVNARIIEKMKALHEKIQALEDEADALEETMEKYERPGF